MAVAASRIVALDALRGAGILGILLTHIQLFAMPLAARWNPTLVGDLGGAGGVVWLITYVLADGKFIVIFAMLFGAGIALQADHRERGGQPTARFHYRRMLALLTVGVAHAYLLWYGDMLVTFALCGALVFWHRGRPPSWLLTVGVASLAVPPLLSSILALVDPGFLVQAAAHASPEAVASEIAAYRGGWMLQETHRARTAWQSHTSYFALRGAWQTSGLMLLGIALLRTGVLTGERPARWYAVLTVGGFGGGAALMWLSARRGFAHAWDLHDHMLVGVHFVTWGNLLVGLGWTGAILLLHRREWVPRAVIAVGRTALSNYLLATLLCTTLFYGHGLGLFGSVDRVGQAAVVVAVWVIQLLASPAWLRRFSNGPVEWGLRRAMAAAPPPGTLTMLGPPA